MVLGRVDLPLGSLVKQYGRPGDRFHEVASAAWKLQTAVKDALAGMPMSWQLRLQVLGSKA